MSKQSVDELNGKAVYSRLLSYVKPYVWAFVAAMLGMIIVAGTEAGFAAIMKPMLDGTFVQKDSWWIKVIPIAVIGIFLIRGIGSFVVTYCMTLVGRKVVRDLRNEMFEQLLHLPNGFYDKNASGQLISKSLYDVEQVAAASSQAITVLVQDTLTLLALLGWMFYLNWQLTLLFLTVGPILSVIVVVINKRLRKISRRLQKSFGDVTHVLQETVEAQRVVKIFGGQDYEQRNFSKANENNRNQSMKITITNAVSVPVVQLVAASLLSAIIYLATRPDMQDTITVGTFMSFIAAVLLLFPPLKRLTTVNSAIQRGIIAADSVFTFLDEDRERDTGTKLLASIQGDVEFDNVSFIYDPAKGEVLKNISFKVEHGKSIAFVGRSGSGKSTLVSLIPRFYQLTSGSIKVDGQDIQEVKLRELRKYIALVSQDITLFNDTIAHNIAYGSLEDATEERIIEAAKAAFAWDFIKDLPEGLQTMVGEHGVMLSGGQRQRIAIARAILKNAPILILDEATSALDTESERHIQAALEQLMKNRTTFVIAHRLSTIEKVDEIMVMNKGEIIERGKHSDLLELNQTYAALYKMQFNDV